MSDTGKTEAEIVETAKAQADSLREAIAAAPPAERVLKAASKVAVRKQHPEFEAAWKALQTAIKTAPAWKTADGRMVRLPSPSDLMDGTAAGPATVERREATLVRLGMPEADRAKVVAAMVRYHNAWKAAGEAAPKAAAEAIEFD